MAAGDETTEVDRLTLGSARNPLLLMIVAPFVLG
jgi:hypothetical protein